MNKTQEGECPICGKVLERNNHYYARTESPHSYHTDKKGVAKQWRYRDGLDVIPEPEPYQEGTLGYFKYIKE